MNRIIRSASGRLLMLLAVIITNLGAFHSEAQTINELGPLKVGEIYTAPFGKRSVGTFLAPKTGKLTVTFKSGHSQVELYTGPELDPETLIEGKFNGNHLEPSTTYDVMEGETYFVEVNLLIQSENSRFILYMDGIASQPFRTTMVNPSANTQYDMIFSEEMFIRFSKDLSEANEVSMIYSSNDGVKTTKELSPDYTRVSNDYLFIRVADALIELLEDEGSDGITPKSSFTIKARVRDENGNFPENADKEGWISYSYTCGYLPTKAISSSWPEEFLSYWIAGDEAGIGTVTFNNELRSSGVGAMLLMGNVEGDHGVDLYRSYIPAKVSGKTVTVDFTGVRRSLTDMMSNPSGTDYMNITITGLYDKNGQAVVSNSQGGVASYVVNLPYRDLAKGFVISDWLPKAGSNLASYDEIEVWISGLDMIRFDGFTVESITAGKPERTEIPMADIKKSDESSDGVEAVFTFSIPRVAKNADSVKIYPTNLISFNGFEYDVFLTALYNAFTYDILEPAQGSEIADLEGVTIRATFNYSSENPEMFVTFTLMEEGGASSSDEDILFEETSMDKDNFNVYSILIDRKMKLYQNKTYLGIFRAWRSESAHDAGETPIGTVTALWYGITPPYQSSPYRFIGITPDEGSDLKESDGVFTVTFDSGIRIDESRSFFIVNEGEPQPFHSVNYVGEDYRENPDDGKIYSAVWNLTVPSEYLTGNYPQLKLVFVAIDEDGRVMAGNRGRNEDSYFEFRYQNTTGIEETWISGESNHVVYNIMGVKILETEAKEDLMKLPNGLYIVDGKKVLICK